MTDDPATFVIVGAGLAGARAAETLREEGFDGRLMLLGAEPERPYERPPLSKAVLKGEEEPATAYCHDADWYAEHGIDLRLGTPVRAIDPVAHEVWLGDGESMRFDRLLLTTGSSVRRLPVAGDDLDGVHYLRTMADAVRLRDAFAAAARVVVVGAGWIGLEAAAAARHHGCAVTLLEPQPSPLHAVLGPEIGGVFAGLHAEHEVTVRLGVGVASLSGHGSVDGVVTSAGDTVPADVVVVGVGIRPNTGLAEAARLAVDNGVVVDAALRTSHPDVFAAGDVANAFNPLLGRHVRVEHWANALNAGPAAARSMLGHEVVYDRVPYFFSDQYDLGMEYSGWAPPGSYDEVVVRGDRERREFVAFWLAAGRVVAGMNANVWDVTQPIQALIRSDEMVDRARLADPDVPLDDLLP